MDYSVKTYSFETRTKGKEPDVLLRKRLDDYYEYYRNSILIINASIDIIKELNNIGKAKSLYDVSPCFAKITLINAWYT